MRLRIPIYCPRDEVSQTTSSAKPSPVATFVAFPILQLIYPISLNKRSDISLKHQVKTLSSPAAASFAGLMFLHNSANKPCLIYKKFCFLLLFSLPRVIFNVQVIDSLYSKVCTQIQHLLNLHWLAESC